jgi:hypothetical protein
MRSNGRGPENVFSRDEFDYRIKEKPMAAGNTGSQQLLYLPVIMRNAQLT